MTAAFLSAWLAFPLVLLLASTGVGLLTRRLAGGELSALMLIPAGFTGVIVLATIGTSMVWLAPGAGVVVAVVAAAGLLLDIISGRLTLRAVRPVGWGPTAGLAAFAAVAAPVVLTWKVGFAGYGRLVDLGFQFDFAQHLASAARQAVGNDSSYHVVVAKMLADGYPGGSQATLGAMAGLIRTDLIWCYQPLLAFMAAMGAISAYVLLRPVIENRPLRFVAASVVMQGDLLYGYTNEGGIKELSTASALLVLAALLSERAPGEGSLRAVLAPAVALAAVISCFSFGVGPWLAILLVGLFVVTLIRKRRRLMTVGAWTAMGATTALLSIPSIISAAKLFGIAKGAIGGVVDLGLGNLAAAIPTQASAGIWLTGDYRFPLTAGNISRSLDVVVFVLAGIGIAYAASRRRWALALLGLSAPFALWYYVNHTSPWLQFKAFTVTTPLVLTLAFAGLAGLMAVARLPFRERRSEGDLAPQGGSAPATPDSRSATALATPTVAFAPRVRSAPKLARAAVAVLGATGILALAGAVLYGDALVYHDTTLAPGAQLYDLEQIGNRFAGQGPTLYPEFSEYAEYLLRREQGSALVNPARGAMTARPNATPPGSGQAFSWDLNQLETSFVESFPLIVLPRDPIGSRPPANYDLVAVTRYFDVWRREASPATVVAHFPLSALPQRPRNPCRALVAAARGAGPGARVAWDPSPELGQLQPVLVPHSPDWQAAGSAVVAHGPGHASGPVSLPLTGTYDVWVQGSVDRPISLTVDGRHSGGARYEDRYPNQWIFLGAGRWSAGDHLVTIARAGGSLAPGNGDGFGAVIGAVLFKLRDPSISQLQYAPASSAGRVCRQVSPRWFEVVAA